MALAPTLPHPSPRCLGVGMPQRAVSSIVNVPSNVSFCVPTVFCGVLIPSLQGSVFIYILFFNRRFYTDSEIHAGIEIVHTLVIDLLTYMHSFQCQ